MCLFLLLEKHFKHVINNNKNFKAKQIKVCKLKQVDMMNFFNPFSWNTLKSVNDKTREKENKKYKRIQKKWSVAYYTFFLFHVDKSQKIFECCFFFLFFFSRYSYYIFMQLHFNFGILLHFFFFLLHIVFILQITIF